MTRPRDHAPAPSLSEKSALSIEGRGRILPLAPPVVFAFPDRRRSVSEEAADFLVKGLLRRMTVPTVAQDLADRIIEERNAGTFQDPGRDIDLTAEEKNYLLEAVNQPDWPADSEDQLTELRDKLVADLEAAD